MKNKTFSLLYLILNALGVVLSFLYGMFGGSGGETTEGVYLGLFSTVIVAVLYITFASIVKFSWFRNNFIWVLLILTLYYPVVSLFVKNNFSDIGKNSIEDMNFGKITKDKYISDKNVVKRFCVININEDYFIDTLLYSSDLKKLIVFGSTKDSLGIYFNFELFVEINPNDTIIHFPKGGNLVSDNENRKILMKNVLNWYIDNYSINKQDEYYIWGYKDFWD